MKILINGNTGLIGFGLGTAFQAMGHQTAMWQEPLKAAFDVFAEFEPDLYVHAPQEHSRAVIKNLKARPKLRTVAYDKPAFDSLTYRPIQGISPQYECDVCHLGAYSPQKLDYLSTVINAGYSVKIYSASHWPIPECVGQLEVSEIPAAYRGAKICLEFGDDDGAFRVIGCGGVCVCTGAMPNSLFTLTATHPSNLLQWLTEPPKPDIIASIRNEVMEKHTYLQRAGEIIMGLHND